MYLVGVSVKIYKRYTWKLLYSRNSIEIDNNISKAIKINFPIIQQCHICSYIQINKYNMQTYVPKYPLSLHPQYLRCKTVTNIC